MDIEPLKEATLAGQPTRELGVGQRVEQPDHGHRYGGSLDQLDHRVRDGSGLAVEAEDEPGRNEHAVVIEKMDVLDEVPSRVLLLLYRGERGRVRALDADE